MLEDKARWNARFNSRSDTAPNTPEFLQDSVNVLKPGSVLDLASGDGAAALFLASKGFETSAMDISDVALGRLKKFAQERNLEIETHVVDLDEMQKSPSDDTSQSEESFHKRFSDLYHNRFDNIVIAHFKPKPEYWPILISWLKPGGKLLITTFNVKHHIENKFSRRFCLEESELINISEQLSIEHYKSTERNGDFMDDYLFVKK